MHNNSSSQEYFSQDSSHKDLIHWVSNLHQRQERKKEKKKLSSFLERSLNSSSVLSRKRNIWSGPRKDYRDPLLLRESLNSFIHTHSWSEKISQAKIFTEWEKIVGKDNANHAKPIKINHGVLTIQADSTSWASQLRLEQRHLLRTINDEVGINVITKLLITGPSTSSWKKASFHIQERGSCDTDG